MSIEIGNRIRKAREAAGLSQAQLAKQVGISQTTIQKIETGETAISKYHAIIWAALRLPLNELNPAFRHVTAQAEPELLEVFTAEQETSIKAQDIVLSRGMRSDGVLMTVLRGDGSKLQIFLEARLAAALARALAKTLAGAEPPEPS